MAHQVLPSKLVDERITVRFEFMDQLEWGETIDEYDVTVSVFAGVDPAPSLLLYLAASRTNTVISQQIHAGTPGVIYQVEASATGSTGNVYQKVARLAVLPSDAILPPIIAVMFSSRPYPLYVVESMESVAGSAAVLMWTRPQDQIDSTFSIMGGELRVSLVSVSIEREELDSTFSVQSGFLYGGIVVADSTESIDSTFDLTGGELRTALISYTNAEPDELASTFSIISGTFS